MANKISKLMSTRFFIIFILLQPFIDLLTSGSMLLWKWEYSFGTIVRSLFLGVMVVYVMFEGSKRIKIYSLFLFAAFGANLIVNYFFKSGFSFFAEIQYMIRYVYTIMTLLTYLTIINRNPETDIKEKIIKYLYYYLVMIVVVFIAADVSDTVITSYAYHRLGHSGWFFAANDIGNTIGMLLPVSFIYAYRKYRTSGALLYFVTPVAAVYPLLMLGTKGGYFAAILGMLGAIAAFGYDVVFLKRKQTMKILLLLTVVLVFSIVIYPKTYVAYNVNYIVAVKGDEGKTQVETEQFIIGGGREDILEETETMSKDADFLQKIFGMGYKGNYGSFYDKGIVVKPIEKDFHELYYYYGSVGLLIYILPMLYLLGYSMMKLLMNLKKITFEHFLYVTSIVLGLFVANFAGHVLSAPSVGYVLMLIMALLYKDVVNLEREEKTIV